MHPLNPAATLIFLTPCTREDNYMAWRFKIEIFQRTKETLLYYVNVTLFCAFPRIRPQIMLYTVGHGFVTLFFTT